jgi:hypothetical protein
MFNKHSQRKKQEKEEFSKQEKEAKETEKQYVAFDDGLILFPGNKSEFEEYFEFPVDFVNIEGSEKFILRDREIPYTKFRGEVNPVFFYGQGSWGDAGKYLMEQRVVALIHYVPYEYYNKGTGVPVKRKDL